MRPFRRTPHERLSIASVGGAPSTTRDDSFFSPFGGVYTFVLRVVEGSAPYHGCVAAFYPVEAIHESPAKRIVYLPVFLERKNARDDEHDAKDFSQKRGIQVLGEEAAEESTAKSRCGE